MPPASGAWPASSRWPRNDPRVMEKSRHQITEAGIGNLLDPLRRTLGGGAAPGQDPGAASANTSTTSGTASGSKRSTRITAAGSSLPTGAWSTSTRNTTCRSASRITTGPDRAAPPGRPAGVVQLRRSPLQHRLGRPGIQLLISRSLIQDRRGASLSFSPLFLAFLCFARGFRSVAGSTWRASPGEALPARLRHRGWRRWRRARHGGLLHRLHGLAASCGRRTPAGVARPLRLGQLEARFLGHQQVDQHAQHALAGRRPWPFSPLPPAMKTRSGTSGWLLWARCSATIDRAYSRGSPNELILRSSTDASDRPTCKTPRAFAAAGQDRAAGSRPGRVTTSLLGLLAGPGQVGLALVLGDLHLHLRVGQLRLHGGLGLGLVQRPQLLGRRPLPLDRSRAARSTVAAAAAVPAASRSCRRPRRCRACRSARPRTRCRSRGTCGRSSSRASLWMASRCCSSSSIVFLWATSRK